jgi:hypothetical protein
LGNAPFPPIALPDSLTGEEGKIQEEPAYNLLGTGRLFCVARTRLFPYNPLGFARSGQSFPQL